MTEALLGTARHRDMVRAILLPERYFVRLAEDEVRQALGETLTTYRPDSIATGLLRIVELYRSRCIWLSNGRLAVTPEQETVFDGFSPQLA